MLSPCSTKYVFGFSALLVLSIGASNCTTQANPLPVQNSIQHGTTRHGAPSGFVLHPDVCPRDRVYISDEGTNSIQVFGENRPHPAGCASITAGIQLPDGIFVDRQGTLYVANYGNSSVTEYPRNQTTPSATLTTGVNYPTNTFVGRDGTLYVPETRFENTVLEFAKGATSPTRVISITNPRGAATDDMNNLYVAYDGTDGNSHVEMFKPKATTGMDLGITVKFAGDIKLTTKNEIVLGDRSKRVVNVYPPGQTVPSRTIHMKHGGDPYHFTLSRDESRLYVAGGSMHVGIYDFQTGAYIDKFGKGAKIPYGVAIDPPAPY